MTVSIEEQIRYVRRELAMRQRTYPKWVEGKRMTQAEMDRQLAAMQAVHDSITLLKEVAQVSPIFGSEVDASPCCLFCTEASVRYDAPESHSADCLWRKLQALI